MWVKHKEEEHSYLTFIPKFCNLLTEFGHFNIEFFFLTGDSIGTGVEVDVQISSLIPCIFSVKKKGIAGRFRMELIGCRYRRGI